MSTNEAAERAIAIVTDSRQTHVNWAEWRREGHGTDEDHEMVGDLAYHEAAIQDYDHVLACLRTVKRSAPIEALVAYLHPRMCRAVRLDGEHHHKRGERAWVEPCEDAAAAIASLLDAAPSPSSEPHPEDFCRRCKGSNLTTWHAPSPLWNTVMRDATGTEAFDGIVCPRCFGELAREKGVAEHFCLTTHDPLVPLPTVFGDGRVWDAETCKWVERSPSADGEAE